MCGRFAITLPPDAVRSFFRYAEQPNFPPRYNIAPTEPVAILRGRREPGLPAERHFMLIRWGFVPQFVKDPKQFPLIINARSETLPAKASFKNALKRRRCLFIADAFYEWRRETKTAPTAKAGRPYLFRRQDGAPLGFAGLWETWMGPNGEEQDTACIITTAANGATAAIHDRLPAILEPDSFDVWLDPDETRADEAFGLLRPPANDVLEFFEIGPAVNKAGNDSPEVQKPAAASGGRANLDHVHDFGLNHSKIMNVIDSKSLERDAGGKPASAFPHPALENAEPCAAPSKPAQGSLF